MRLYKYCDHRGLDILRTLRLKVTPPNKFNDIFEFTPTSIGANPVKWAEAEEIPQFAPQIRRRLAARGKIFEGSDEEFRDFVEREAKEPVLASPDQVREMCRGILDHISKTHGIICFSKRKNNLLMWSHYADGHKGVVIGFDVPHHLKTLEADYKSRRLPWRLSKDSTPQEFLQETENLVRRKSCHWRYEREVRLLWSFADCERDVDCNGTAQYFKAITPATIKEVILGYRCDVNSAIEKAVRHWIEQNRLQVELQRAEPSESRFAVNFRTMGLAVMEETDRL
ncbi:MAG TPA: DUF2971 domain-containing protein [Chthoniobacterales bacterium]